MEKLKPILKFLKNKYFIVGAIALVWMLFLDQYDVFSHIRMHNRIQQLESEKAFYTQEKERIEKEKMLLTTDPEALERFAREELWMKKDDEDLFIVVDRKKDPQE